MSPVKRRANILVADDEEAIVGMLQEALRMVPYDVRTAPNGEEALQQIQKLPPDLVVLDIQMPKLDGYEVCKRLKSDVYLRHIPVLMLTAQAGTRSKVRGLEFGADDYLTKPFEMEELLARIQTLLRRAQVDLEANPLTRLPGNIAIENEILHRVQNKTPFAVLYVDLNSFKAYNDVYGFVKGDEVITATSRIVRAAADPHKAFVGHIGGDDFIVVTTPENYETICQKILRDFDAKVPEFYSQEDRAKGYVSTKDRRGQVTKFPLLSIAVGVVTNQHRELTSLGEVSKIGAEMKHFAKEKAGSNFAVDRRKE